jgi:hypothetical protein
MNKRRMIWLLLSVLIIFGALSLTACQTGTAQRQPTGNEALKTTPASDAAIRLNNEEMGTTNNLSDTVAEFVFRSTVLDIMVIFQQKEYHHYVFETLGY